MAGDSRTLTANFVADTSGFSPKINELIQKLKVLNQDFEQNKSKVKELQTQLKAYENELKQLNTSTNNGASANEEQRKRMQELRDSIARCNVEIGTYRAAQTNLRSQISSTNRELNEQRDAVNEERDALNDTSDAAETFGDVLKANLASSAITSALQKLLSLLKQAAEYCYNVGSSFEAAMSKVEAVSGASGAELEQLTEKAEALGASTRFTATEAAEAMNYMAMAGWDAEQMLAGIDGVISLAAASGSDLAATSDIVTDAISAFGLEAEDVGHFANVLAAASANANTNVEMMGETFKYVAPIAGALGYSIDDVAEAIGLMANSGIKSSMAGTALRTMLSKLAEGATLTGEAIGEVTISATNADGSMRDLNEVLSELRENWALLTESEQVANADSIFGSYAKSGALALLNAQTEDIEKLRAAIEDCDGAAADMAETMQDNVSGAVTQFNSALEGVGVAIYGKFKDGLLDVVNIFTECMSDLSESAEAGAVGESMEKLADSFKDAATELAGFVKDNLPGFIKGIANMLDTIIKFRDEIGTAVKMLVTFKSTMAIEKIIVAAVKAFITLKTATQGATVAQTAFNAAVNANPLGLIAGAISLVVGVVSELAAHTKDAAEEIEELRQASDDAAQSARDYAEKAEALRKVKDRYEEIQSSAESAYDKEQDLKALQDELIAQYPDLKGQIDLVTGAYLDQAAAIQSVIDKQDAEAKSDAIVAYNKMVEAEEEEKEVAAFSGYSHSKNLQIPFVKRDYYTELSQALQNEEVQKIFEELSEDYEGLHYYNRNDTSTDRDYNVEITGSSEEKYEAFSALVKAFEENGLADSGGVVSDLYNELREDMATYSEAVEANKQTLETYNKLVLGEEEIDYAGSARWAEAWDRANSPYDDEEEETPAVNLKKTLSAEERKELYDEEKQLADDQYSVGEISAEEYYNKLKSLRDQYLDEGTHEWYQATATIQSVYDKWAKAASDSASSVKSSLSEVQMAYEKTLDAIDAEYEKHNREKSDNEFQSKIDEIDRELQYGRVDEFEKYELEKQRQDLIDEHNEELYERQYSDARDVVKDAYNARQTLDKADAGTREYTIALGDYTDALGELSAVMQGIGQALGIQNNNSSSVSNIDESTKNNYVNVILQAVNKSNSQIVDELIKALKSDL